jgi:serine/threonine-protein kinase
MLESTTSTGGLVLASDLYAATGQLARAVGTIERVLAREIDAPGARERHRRWRAALGFAPPPVRRLDEATLIAARPHLTAFRLLRELARGGSGVVYEAEDEVLLRRVAFKVYHGRGADRVPLEREVRSAAAFSGPGIVRVFDADPMEGWVALEWVPRGSVRDVLRAGDVATLLPIGRWAKPLARALARVHSREFVHADVKPANVLLRQLSDPVLGDFGIARLRGEPSVGGSPGYVSPERLAGRPSDPRDDVYGFGRILEDVIHRIDAASGAVPSASPPSLPEDQELTAWREVTMRCLGPDEGRPADGADLLRSLP